MNRKKTEKRKIEWLEVIPIAIIVISTMVVGWVVFNKTYEDKKKYYQIRRELQQVQRDIAIRKYKQSMKEYWQIKTELQHIERDISIRKNKQTQKN